MKKGRTATQSIVTIYILFFVVSLACAIIGSIIEESEINSNIKDYARITDLDYKAVVVDEYNSQGKVVVTERITFDVHAASENNLFWELWRDLVEDNDTGVRTKYKVKSVKQILDDGREIIYEESPKLYWDDNDYVNTYGGLGPGKWYHSEGPYDEEMERYECVFFYVDGLYREKVTFEIEYEMTNAALMYNDCSELYLCMYSEDTIKYLDSFKAEILVPQKDMPRVGNYEAHTYGTNNESFEFFESDIKNPGYHTFYFELDKEDLNFKPYNQYIEFSLISFGEDKHRFCDYAPTEYYSFYNMLEHLRQEQKEYEALPEEYKAKKEIVLIISCISVVILFIKTFVTDKKINKKHTFYKSEMPLGYFRDIPSNLDPSFATTLVFSKHKAPKNTDIYAALMLSLVRKKYIVLEKIDEEKDWDIGNIEIIIKYKPIALTSDALERELVMPEGFEMLTKTEQYYFDMIIKHAQGSDRLKMKVFQDRISSDYNNTDSFVKKVENASSEIGIDEGYFQKLNYDEPRNNMKKKAKNYTCIGILFITLVNMISDLSRLELAYGAFFIIGIAFIISAIYLNKISKQYILLTQKGEDEYIKWRGLYNFLNSGTLMHEKTVIELPLWEQYLVYATAFGISEKVTKALKIRCPEAELDNTASMLSNSYYYSPRFRVSSHSFRTTIHSASRTARISSYGGHGGYGGGGRGGGGGGGGH